MKVKVFCDCTVITGHCPGEESCRSSCYNLVLPDGMDEVALKDAIKKSMPRGGPLVKYEFNRYEIIK